MKKTVAAARAAFSPRQRRALARRAVEFAAALVDLTGAFAQVEPVRLVYESRGACSDRVRFVEEITNLIGTPRLSAGQGPAGTFTVSVGPDGARARGSLQITGLDGVVSRREFDGDTCAEVIAALALTTASPRMDPRAIGGPDGDAPKPSAPVEAPPELPLFEPTARPAATRWRWAMGLQGDGVLDLVPGGVFGGGGFVEVASSASGILAPSFRLSLLAETTQASFASSIGANPHVVDRKRRHFVPSVLASPSPQPHVSTSTPAFSRPPAPASLILRLTLGPGSYQVCSVAGELVLRRRPLHRRSNT